MFESNFRICFLKYPVYMLIPFILPLICFFLLPFILVLSGFPLSFLLPGLVRAQHVLGWVGALWGAWPDIQQRKRGRVRGLQDRYARRSPSSSTTAVATAASRAERAALFPQAADRQTIPAQSLVSAQPSSKRQGRGDTSAHKALATHQTLLLYIPPSLSLHLSLPLSLGRLWRLAPSARLLHSFAADTTAHSLASSISALLHSARPLPAPRMVQPVPGGLLSWPV